VSIFTNTPIELILGVFPDVRKSGSADNKNGDCPDLQDSSLHYYHTMKSKEN
jgi:hypothetical protein